MALIEAMAAGLAVVASAVGAVPEIVTSPEFGILIAPGDRVALRDAIIELARDDARRERMGRALRARAEHEYTVQTSELALASVYERMLEEPGR